MAPTTASWTSATALNTALTSSTSGYDTVIITISPPAGLTAGAVTFEAFDGTNWVTIKAPRTDSYLTNSTFALSGSPGTRSWQLSVAGYPQVRARLSTAIVGAGTVGLVSIVSSAPDVSLVTVGLDPGQSLPAGSNTIGNVGVNNNPVGATSIATSQASIGVAASQIVAARAGAAGTGRIAATLYNFGSATVFFGVSGVTGATGMPLPAGSAVTLNTTAAIFGIAASGTQIIGVTETF